MWNQGWKDISVIVPFLPGLTFAGRLMKAVPTRRIFSWAKWKSFIYTGELPIDVALLQVSPPDEHGFLSYGVGVDITMSAAQVAKVVIAQVNPEMPRVHGDCFIHINKITHVVEHSAPLLEMPQGTPDEVSMTIGRLIAEQIEDGSTLQMGIGAIPDAFLVALQGRHDMGIHTEMFSDGIIPLVENGVINNSKKPFIRGK